jgi:dTDP-4-amino-4,6-dideoxy-D-galactose acyltransferase
LRGKLGNEDDSLLYVYLKDDNADLHQHLVSEGALFFDTRIIYAKELSQDNLCKSTVEIRDYKGGVDETIRKLAVQAGRYSRFHNDERLRPYFDGLYTAWIRNSISGAIADKVFVYEKDSAISALATCVVKGGEGWTGLISVDATCQGKGIGTSLMAAIERYFFENHIKRSLVITQEDNLKACKFYESCGYEIIRREFIYHWWI